MYEETESPDQAVIALTPEEYNDLERAMQWPEDLARWDRTNTPTPVTEMNEFFN